MSRIRYVNGELAVVLEVPWDDGSNRIPPSSIRFTISGDTDTLTFVYAGEEPGSEEGR